MTELEAAANRVIRAAVRERRPGMENGWMFAVPSGSLSLEPQAWFGFLSDVLATYHADNTVRPKRTAAQSEFEGLINKQLIVLRRAIVAKTV